MSELPTEFPENHVPTAEHHAASAAEAFERALYGDGVGVVERVGVSDDVRQTMLAKITQTESKRLDNNWQHQIDQYTEFDPADITPILEEIIPGLVELLEQQNQDTEPYDAVNLQLNRYQTGSALEPHFDFSEEYWTPNNPNEPIKSLSIIYVVDGGRIWWFGHDRPAGSARRHKLFDNDPICCWQLEDLHSRTMI
jgi:hypothetical protein